MRRSNAARSWNRSTILIALATCLALVIAVAIGARVLAATGGEPSKADRMQQAAAAATARAQEPHATKHSHTPIASCPVTRTTGIFPYRPIDEPRNAPMNNEAAIQVAGRFDYLVVAGSTESGSTQGVLFVQPMYTDPCKEHDPGVPNPTWYPDPHQDGSLTVTAINGVIVEFSAADGATGSFNVVTDTYQ